jgi:hypothetical protein
MKALNYVLDDRDLQPRYVLVKGRIKRASLREWLAFRASPRCIIASTDIGTVNVTTIFTGDAEFPYLTMTFNDKPMLNNSQTKSRDVALMVHEEHCKEVLAHLA